MSGGHVALSQGWPDAQSNSALREICSCFLPEQGLWENGAEVHRMVWREIPHPTRSCLSPSCSRATCVAKKYTIEESSKDFKRRLKYIVLMYGTGNDPRMPSWKLCIIAGNSYCTPPECRIVHRENARSIWKILCGRSFVTTALGLATQSWLYVRKAGVLLWRNEDEKVKQAGEVRTWQSYARPGWRSWAAPARQWSLAVPGSSRIVIWNPQPGSPDEFRTCGNRRVLAFSSDHLV